jgi:hypothetical protein
VRGLRYLWLIVPGLGVGELLLHVWFATRAPRVEEWRELAQAVAAQKRAGEPLVIAPDWAEPLARHAFGDRLFPLAELARSDDAAVRRVLEVSALGARNAATRGWHVVSESRAGRFTLRVLENPAPLAITYRFLDHVNPRDLAVAVLRGGDTVPCAFTDHARVTAGGLHGQVAFPRERFACRGSESTFVGITVIDDQDYRGRRCIWAEPPPGGTLRLTFSEVPLARELRGFAGLSYFLFRDSPAPALTLTLTSDGTLLGSYVHQDAGGWHPFRIGTPARSERSATVELDVAAGEAAGRDFCFALEVVR